ncbi:MAG: hypothetical protein V1904_04445 [Bacteroidota bacterium]
MKKLFFILIALVAFNLSLSAQKDYKHVIKINILPVMSEFSDYLSYVNFRTQFSVMHEFNTGKKHVPYLQLSYVGPMGYKYNIGYENSSEDNNLNYSGFGISAGSKTYLNEKHNGYYFAPQISFLRYINYKAESEDDFRTRVFDFTFSIITGKQFVKNSGFTVDIYTGVGCSYKNYLDFIKDSDTDYSNYHGIGVRPYLGLMIGYSF